MSAAFRRVFGTRSRVDSSALGIPKRLIVGLGNPGQGYSGNRHNVGFMAVAYIAKSFGMHFDKRKGEARIAEGNINDVPVVLARPQTYMNASGKAVSTLLGKYKLTFDDLIVIHDDLDLPVGRIRIRKGGSSGGHKGIQSIIENVGSPEFLRVRVGIGRPTGEASRERENGVIDYVLGDFSREERTIIEDSIPRVAEAVTSIIVDGFEKAMSKFNVAPVEKATQPDAPQ